MICPVYGDYYSFPWKRGPHDSILEYIEASQFFETLRTKIFFELKGQDFITKALQVYFQEEESQQLEVRCSVLRFLLQLLRSFDTRLPKGERALDFYLQNPTLMKTAQSIAFSAQDPVLQAAAVQLISRVVKQAGQEQSLDRSSLNLEIQKVYLLFEKSCKTEPVVAAACCSLMNEMLQGDK